MSATTLWMLKSANCWTVCPEWMVRQSFPGGSLLCPLRQLLHLRSMIIFSKSIELKWIRKSGFGYLLLGSDVIYCWIAWIIRQTGIWVFGQRIVLVDVWRYESIHLQILIKHSHPHSICAVTHVHCSVCVKTGCFAKIKLLATHSGK